MKTQVYKVFRAHIMPQGRPPIPIEVTLLYSLDSPYEVEMIADVPDEDKYYWSFGRDTLLSAMRDGSAGIGDVSIRCNSVMTYVRLHNPNEGTGIVGFDTQQVKRFLIDSLRLCPTGHEAQYIMPQIDEALRDILDGV